MVRPRSLVQPEGKLGTYHVISRCTRRAFLLGDGRCYRRAWVTGELSELLSTFSIDLLAYAVMSNHVHLILRPRPDLVENWDAERVARAGMRHMPVRTGVANECLPVTPEIVSQFASQRPWVAEYRSRLSSVSWLMRLFKQHIATRANREDNCTGHFWESRYHSVPLLDLSAVLACMIYVDLNPFRAKLSPTVDDVIYTSLRARIGFEPVEGDVALSGCLTPLAQCRPPDPYTGRIARLGMSASDYRSLLRRAAGVADSADMERTASLGARLSYDWERWDRRMSQPGLFQAACAGAPESREIYAQSLGRKWIADKTGIWL